MRSTLNREPDAPAARRLQYSSIAGWSARSVPGATGGIAPKGPHSFSCIPLAGQLAIRRGAAVGRDHRGGLHVQIEVDGEVSDAQMIRMRVCGVLGGELVLLCQYL